MVKNDKILGMAREIDDETAKRFAQIINRSFEKAPNDSIKGAKYLAETPGSEELLQYYEEELFGNPIIRQTLIDAYKDVGPHPQMYKHDEEKLEEVFLSELEKVLRRARNKSY